MKTYHKIQTVFHRDPDNNFRTLLEGQFALPEFEYLKDNEWVFTEKVDGTNIRIMYGDGIKYGGKTDNAQLHNDLIQRLHDIFDCQLDRFKEQFPNPTDSPTEVCFYGEGYGAGIQKGGGNYQEHKDFVLFDVKIGGWWLQRADVDDIAIKFGLKIVPIIGKGTLDNMVEMVRKGFNSQWGNFEAEGIVARPKTELFTRNGKRIITKIKQKDFK